MKGFGLALAFLLNLTLAACSASEPGPLAVGDAAPPFTLREAIGGEVPLSAFAGKSPVLLYFHMAYG